MNSSELAQIIYKAAMRDAQLFRDYPNSPEARLAEAAIALDCYPEDTPIEGNCSAIDEATDKATEDRIREELENGNQWAWCSVKVTVCYRGFSAREFLGGCSYDSEKEFREPGGYFDDMVIAASQQIAEKLLAAEALLKALETDPNQYSQCRSEDLAFTNDK